MAIFRVFSRIISQYGVVHIFTMFLYPSWGDLRATSVGPSLHTTLKMAIFAKNGNFSYVFRIISQLGAVPILLCFSLPI